MAFSRNKKESSGDSLLDQLAGKLMANQAANSDVNIIEFIETICDAFDLTLFLSQRVILKAIYGIPMEPEEEIVLQKWRSEKKTNWKSKQELLDEVNNSRVKKGYEPYELDKWTFNYQNITLQAGMRCITGDSYLFLPNKGYVKIQDILPKAEMNDIQTPLNIMVQTRHGVKEVVAGLSRTSKHTKRVSTRYGYEIEGSLQHPLLVQTPQGLIWKKMSELNKGDYLCIERKPLNKNLYPQDHTFAYKDKTISGPKLAYVLGLLTGDGSCGQETSITLTSMDSEIQKEFFELETFFGKNVSSYNKAGNAATDLKIYGKEIREWLHEVAGLGYCGAYTKTIPNWIMEGSQEEIKQFLRGLYDTDGYATANKTTVGIGLCSEEMIRQIQILLTGFGIISCRKKHVLPYIRKNNENSVTWKLEINGDDARKFRDLIGFGLTRKQVTVEAYGDYNGHGSTVDKIPHLVTKLREAKLLEKSTQRGSGRSEKWGKIRRQCGGTTRRVNKEKESGITYGLLPNVIEYYSGIQGAETLTKELEIYNSQNLFFDEIVSIEDGNDYVYDICVPEVSEYVANGIVSHNSSKSSLVGLIVVYEFFKLITSPNPQRELGVPTSSMIYITVLASTERQTQGTIYGYVKNYIEGSTFFKSFISEGRILVKENEIEFPEKNVRIAAGHSRATSIVGRSAVLVAFDELAMFSNDDGHTSNAGEVYSRVGRAAATFGSKSKRIAMSSVKCEGDYMEELVRDTWDKQISQKALVFDLTTFDINPIMTMENPIIASDYEKDIVTAQRDYENIRPGAISGFLNPLVVDAATTELVKDSTTGLDVVQKRDPMKHCVYRPYELQRINPMTGELKIMSAIELALIQPLDHGKESYIHLDPGFVNDSYGLVCGHAEVTPDGVATVIDIVLEWIPKQLGKGQVAKVDIQNVEEAIIQIAQKRNVVRVTFDHFQNESSIQNLWQRGIDARTQHFGAGIQKKIYDLLRVRLNAGLVRIPAHPSLVEELKNLIVTAGERVDHPKSKDSIIQGKGKISKDLSDCLAMVNYIIAMQEKSFIRGDDNFHLGEGYSVAQGNAIALTDIQTSKSRINWKFS